MTVALSVRTVQLQEKSGGQQTAATGSRVGSSSAGRKAKALQLEPLFRWLALIMDEFLRLPGTKFRFGLDPLLGLLPGVGDTASAIRFRIRLASGSAIWIAENRSRSHVTEHPDQRTRRNHSRHRRRVLFLVQIECAQLPDSSRACHWDAEDAT